MELMQELNFQDQIKLALQLSNLEDFSFREIDINGEICILCNPKPNFRNWIEENLILRSVIYRKNDYFPISLSWPKFFNDLERPDLRKLPDDISQITWLQKMDGSCILVSRNGIIRTRGSHTVDQHDTGPEVRRLIEDYKINSIFDQCSGDYTLAFEHVTPSHKIVLNYAIPDLIFIGKISHDNYKLDSQWALDQFAKIYGLKRPLTYKFNSYEVAIKEIKGWEDQEGVVAYYENDQKMVKIKALQYCRLHSLKSSYGSYNKLIEEYLIYKNSAHIGNFFHYIGTMTDYEVARFCEDKIKVIEMANSLITIEQDCIENFCNQSWENKKVFALAAKQEFNPEQLAYAFEIRAKKEISSKSKKRWLENKIAFLTGTEES